MALDILTPGPVLTIVETSPNVIEVVRQGAAGPVGPQGPSVSDGDKGDVVVSSAGATWTIDPALLTTYMRTITAAASEAAFKAAVNLEIGTDVQAYSSVLAATTASFLTAHATKLGHITVTQAVDLDAIETSAAASAASLAAFSANGTSLVTAANYAAMRTLLGLVIGTNVQAYSAVLATLTGASANGQSLVTAADYAAMRTLLGLVIGTNVQAYDADLAALAALTSAANKLPYATGAQMWNLTDIIPVSTALSPAPTIEGLTTPGVGTYSANAGAYTRIGNQIEVNEVLSWSAHTGTGNMKIANALPVVAVDNFSPLTIISDSLTYGAGTLIAYTTAGSRDVTIALQASGAAIGLIAMDTAATIWLRGTYRA